MIAGASFDVWSSERMNSLVDQRVARETNGLYADDRGHYVTARAAPIECGMYAGIAGGEYLLLRKYPKLARAFSIVNFGLSGIGFTSGVRNMVLRSKLSNP